MAMQSFSQAEYIEQPPCTLAEYIATGLTVLWFPLFVGKLEHARHPTDSLTASVHTARIALRTSL